MLLSADQTRTLFGQALERRRAVLAVNADSPPAVVDVLEAARRCAAPVLIEASLWQLTGHSFGAGDPFLGMRQYLAVLRTLCAGERFAEVPVAFHTDHIKGPQTEALLTDAIALGVSSVSLDSSALSEAENVALAARLCAFAGERLLPLTLEMEAGVDDGLTPLDVTDRVVGGIEARFPGALALWAPGCGTRHGLSADGFPEFSAAHVAAQQQRASARAGRPIGIALHGSSGLSDDGLRAAVDAGVVKVNWSSEALLLRSQAARDYYRTFGARLEAGAPGFKEAAMDNGVQSFVSERVVPRIAERIALLWGT
jgi:fructose/tagatose bisphosphate aldolase